MKGVILETRLVPRAAIANALTVTKAGLVLDARQGKVLDEKIAAMAAQMLAVTIPSGQWSGSGSDYYFSVTASNVTANSILIPSFDKASGALLKGPVWCVPAAGSFTVHTKAIPAGTVTILVQFIGTMGTANYQVLADVYSKSQVDSIVSQSTAIMDVSSGITAVAAYVDTSAQLELRARKQLNIVAFQFSFRASAASTSGQAILTGLPPALVNSYQFVAMNITTQKPITMAVMANGALAFWYSENGFSAGDRIRGSVTYICA